MIGTYQVSGGGRAVQRVRGRPGELGHHARGHARAGARLDQPARGIDRGGIEPVRGGAPPITSTTSPRGGAEA